MGAGDTEQAGRAFVEVTGVVREWLVEATPRDALVHLLLTLDPEDLGYVSESIPQEILADVSRELESATGRHSRSRFSMKRSRSVIT